jgi:hypothetical protein
MTQQIALDLPESIIEQAQAIADREGRTINAVFVEWIERSLSLYAHNDNDVGTDVLPRIKRSSDIPLLAKEKQSVTTAPQALLVPSNAGMRLIAQLTIFNKGDFNRLRDYITENYAPEALEFASAKARLVEFKAVFRMSGKMRIDRVIAADKHQALVVVEGEHGDFYMMQVTVSEDYPHKVLMSTFNKGAEA